MMAHRQQTQTDSPYRLLATNYKRTRQLNQFYCVQITSVQEEAYAEDCTLQFKQAAVLSVIQSTSTQQDFYALHKR